MNIEQRAARDAARITSNPNEAGTQVTLTTPDGTITKTVVAGTTKHMLRDDLNGFKSIGKTASAWVSESVLVAADYPVRVNNEISLVGHVVSWTDVSGLTWKYTVRSIRPDEKIGLITLMLDDYNS